MAFDSLISIWSDPRRAEQRNRSQGADSLFGHQVYSHIRCVRTTRVRKSRDSKMKSLEIKCIRTSRIKKSCIRTISVRKSSLFEQKFGNRVYSDNTNSEIKCIRTTRVSGHKANSDLQRIHTSLFGQHCLIGHQTYSDNCAPITSVMEMHINWTSELRYYAREFIYKKAISLDNSDISIDEACSRNKNYFTVADW